MRLLRLCRIALSLSALLCTRLSAQTSVFTSPLPTGVRLDPIGDVVELGSLPLNVVVAHNWDKAIVVLSGRDRHDVFLIAIPYLDILTAILG